MSEWSSVLETLRTIAFVAYYFISGILLSVDLDQISKRTVRFQLPIQDSIQQIDQDSEINDAFPDPIDPILVTAAEYECDAPETDSSSFSETSYSPLHVSEAEDSSDENDVDITLLPNLPLPTPPCDINDMAENMNEGASLIPLPPDFESIDEGDKSEQNTIHKLSINIFPPPELSDSADEGVVMTVPKIQLRPVPTSPPTPEPSESDEEEDENFTCMRRLLLDVVLSEVWSRLTTTLRGQRRPGTKVKSITMQLMAERGLELIAPMGFGSISNPFRRR